MVHACPESHGVGEGNESLWPLLLPSLYFPLWVFSLELVDKDVVSSPFALLTLLVWLRVPRVV